MPSLEAPNKDNWNILGLGLKYVTQYLGQKQIS